MPEKTAFLPNNEKFLIVKFLELNSFTKEFYIVSSKSQGGFLFLVFSNFLSFLSVCRRIIIRNKSSIPNNVFFALATLLTHSKI